MKQMIIKKKKTNTKDLQQIKILQEYILHELCNNVINHATEWDQSVVTSSNA